MKKTKPRRGFFGGHWKTVLVSVSLAALAACADPSLINEAKAQEDPDRVTVVCEGGKFRLGETQDCFGEASDGTEAEPKGRTVKAYVTGYSRKDSCHNPKTVDGKVWCLTAIGRDTVEGVTVACPRSLKLGTKVRIWGKVYVCEDRYAKRLDAQRGLPTFDVFTESHATALKAGKRLAEVEVLD